MWDLSTSSSIYFILNLSKWTFKLDFLKNPKKKKILSSGIFASSWCCFPGAVFKVGKSSILFKLSFKMFILNSWNLDHAFHWEWNLTKGFPDRLRKMHPVMHLGFMADVTRADLLVCENSTSVIKCKQVTEWQPEKGHNPSLNTVVKIISLPFMHIN